MRILFVSGTGVGGALASTLDLARALQGEGHVAQVLAPGQARATARLYRRLDNAAIRMRDPAPLLSLNEAIGRRLALDADGIWRSAVVENGFARLLRGFAPEICVLNSVYLSAHRHIASRCASAGVPLALYIREAAAVDRFERHPAPDLTICNTASLTGRLRDKGVEVAFIPSVVGVPPVAHEMAPPVDVLLVNPLHSHGVDVAVAVASALPEIQVVLQESWPLDAALRRRLLDTCDSLPNCRLRQRVKTDEVFNGVHILLAPHRIDNRPRVITEAIMRGIPVLVSPLPGLMEVSPAGVTAVAQADDHAAWVAAVSTMLEEPLFELMRSQATAAGRVLQDQQREHTASLVEALKGIL